MARKRYETAEGCALGVPRGAGAWSVVLSAALLGGCAAGGGGEGESVAAARDDSPKQQAGTEAEAGELEWNGERIVRGARREEKELAGPVRPEASPPVSVAEADAPAPGAGPSPTRVEPGEAVVGASPEEEPSSRRRKVAAELAAMEAEAARRAEERGESPMAALVRAASLEVIEPGSFDHARSAVQSLHPREAALIEAWRGAMHEVGTRLKPSESDAARALSADDLAAAMEPLAEAARGWGGLSIAKAALCSKVDSFGVYQEIAAKREGAYQLIAGRKQRLIVYTEIDHFTHQRATREGREGYLVALSQDLMLYSPSEQGDLMAWRRPAQRIEDFSLNRRRDFFMIQIVELPETLSVGKYRLKVRMRDEHGGGEAEALIPLEVVADASAMK